MVELADNFAPNGKRGLSDEARARAAAYEALVPPTKVDRVIRAAQSTESTRAFSARVPSEELVQALAQSETKIRALRIAPEALNVPKLPTLEYGGGGTVSESDYSQVVSPRVAEALDTILAGLDADRAVIRVSSLSLNGGLVSDSKDDALVVPDIRHAVSMGVDRDSDGDAAVVTAAVYRAGAGAEGIHTHVNHAAAMGAVILRDKAQRQPEFAKTSANRGVFPVMFVYDRAKMDYLQGYNFVPKPGVELRDALVMAIILPVLEH